MRTLVSQSLAKIYFRMKSIHNKVKREILLQCKFFLVQLLNFTSNVVPNPLRRYYLRLYGFRLGENSVIHRGCKYFHVGKLSIGKNTVINFGCYIDNRRGVSIGNNVGIAHNTKIYTLGHNINSELFETKGAPVCIKDNCFVFSNTLIMPGVTIGEGAVVLAGSVVTKDVDPWTVVGGNPAKFVRKREQNIKYTVNYKYWFAL